MSSDRPESVDKSVDYYAVLQVRDDADPEVIQAAYRRLTRKYGAETDGNPEAAERLRALKDAYAVVGNPSRRAAYDEAASASLAAQAALPAGVAREVGPPPTPSAALEIEAATAAEKQAVGPPPGESVTEGQWITWLEGVFPLIFASALVVVCIIGIYNGFRQLP